MMLLGRWGVAAGLGLGLVLGAAGSLGQMAKKTGHVVQPDDGPPPEQAVQPDPPAQYEHAGDPEPPPEPEPASASQMAPEAPAAVEAAEPKPSLPPEPVAAAAVVGAPSPAHSDNGVQSPLQKDTAALLQLAEDLRAEIEKAGSNTLSVVAIRKADEIQKLSKNLKERMRNHEQTPATK